MICFRGCRSNRAGSRLDSDSFSLAGLLLAALLNAILPLCRSAVARHNWALGTAGDDGAGAQSRHSCPSTTSREAARAALAEPSPVPPLRLRRVSCALDRLAGGPLACRNCAAEPARAWRLVLVQSLRAAIRLPCPPICCNAAMNLQCRLAVAGPVRFLLSRRIDVPVVVGWLRPRDPDSGLGDCRPLAAAAGRADSARTRPYPPARHRHQHLLVAVETFLFYHPAVWWVSRRVRIEREHCCDDFAVSACGDAAIYVEALTSLETWKRRRRGFLPWRRMAAG